MNDFELERQQRIETNRKRMLEMGIQAMASKIQAPAPIPAPPVRARPFQTHQSNPFLFPARLHPERRAASLDDDTRGVAASRAPIRSGLHRATSLIIVQSGFLYFIHIVRARITPMATGARHRRFPAHRGLAPSRRPPPHPLPASPRLPQQRKRCVKAFVPEEARRRSTRERVEVNYAERYGLEHGDDDDDVKNAASRARANKSKPRARLVSMSDGDHARVRYSVGRRVYDSELGTTCHWCRQKTVETHVTVRPHTRAHIPVTSSLQTHISPQTKSFRQNPPFTDD